MVDGPSRATTCSRWSSARADSSSAEARVERRAVEERTEEVLHSGGPGVARPAPGVAGQVDGGAGRSVVRAVGGEHLRASGVEAGHPDRVLDGLGACVGEEDLGPLAQAATRPTIRRAASLRWSLACWGAIVQSRAACSRMASTTTGCWCPMLVLTICDEKSR